MLYHKKTKKQKNPKQLERHFKGIANHRRIEVIFLIYQNPGMTLENISENLKCNMKTISVHLGRLVQAGLINKNYKGRNVEHTLSPYGKALHDFMLKL